MEIAPYCLCAVVSDKALAALLEASGKGTYRDHRPWLIAAELHERCQARGERLPIVFATGSPARFSHWGFVERIEVVELHRGRFTTACEFTRLSPVNPIFEAVDSVFLKPASERLDREAREGITRHRYPVTEAELRPYAICETLAFILKEEDSYFNGSIPLSRLVWVFGLSSARDAGDCGEVTNRANRLRSMEPLPDAWQGVSGSRGLGRAGCRVLISVRRTDQEGLGVARHAEAAGEGVLGC